jgi:tRNA(Ile)-lysidine synthase TilS/MesJ
VVDEVTRGVTARDQYEKVARDIRYQFYRTCLREAAAEGSEREGEEGGREGEEGEGKSSGRILSGVIFGHHQGDVQENVISNVMRFVRAPCR